MIHIELITNLDLQVQGTVEKDLEVVELLNETFARILEIRLNNGAVLKRHKADEPITVLCLSGKGVFRAGNELEDEIEFRAGTLITLATGTQHEAVADPQMHLLVSRFKRQ
jgi:quercetin dioxygenase-like cupin family protein